MLSFFYLGQQILYPMGHHLIITKDFKDIHGLIKCEVLPPRGLYLPVLPYRCNGKLMFSLCRKCVENQEKDVCKHSNTDRCSIGTWVMKEIKEAVKKGYQVTKVKFSLLCMIFKIMLG